MEKKQWYESLFEGYGQTYDSEGFTNGTIGECDFIEQELDYNKSLKILDVGCGTGRHSIELARRGYKVLIITVVGHALRLIQLIKTCNYDTRLLLRQGITRRQNVHHILLWTPKPWPRRALNHLTFVALRQGLLRGRNT